MHVVSVVCETCGSRDLRRHTEDGECRECRGIERPDPVDTGPRTHPDQIEKDPVAHRMRVAGNLI